MSTTFSWAHAAMAIQYEVVMNTSYNSTYDATNEHPNDVISEQSDILFIIYLSLILLVGVPGNIIVAIVYGRTIPKSACDYLILTMGITDACVCCLSPILLLRAEFHAVVPWMNRALCCLEFWVQLTTMFTSSVILVIIAMDRYVKICKPKLPSLTPVMARNACICSVIFCGAFCVFPAIKSAQDPRCLNNHIRLDMGARFYLTVLLSFFALSFMLVTYAYINVIRQISEKIKIKQRLIENTGLKPCEEVKDSRAELEKTVSVLTAWRRVFTRWRAKTRMRVDATLGPDAHLQMLPSEVEKNVGENIMNSKNDHKDDTLDETAALLARVSGIEPSLTKNSDCPQLRLSDHLVNGDCGHSEVSETPGHIHECQDSLRENKRIGLRGETSPIAAELREKLERVRDSTSPGHIQMGVNYTSINKCNGSCNRCQNAIACNAETIDEGPGVSLCLPSTLKPGPECGELARSPKSLEIQTITQKRFFPCDYYERDQHSASEEILPCSVCGQTPETKLLCDLDMMPAQIPSEHTQVGCSRQTHQSTRDRVINGGSGCPDQGNGTINNIISQCDGELTHCPRHSPSDERVRYCAGRQARRLSSPVCLHGCGDHRSKSSRNSLATSERNIDRDNYPDHTCYACRALSHKNKQFHSTSSLSVHCTKTSPTAQSNKDFDHQQAQLEMAQSRDLNVDRSAIVAGPTEAASHPDLRQCDSICSKTSECTSEDPENACLDHSVLLGSRPVSYGTIQSGYACTEYKSKPIDSAILNTETTESWDNVSTQHHNTTTFQERHEIIDVGGDQLQALKQISSDMEQKPTSLRLNNYSLCDSREPVDLQSIASDRDTKQVPSETNSALSSFASTSCPKQNRRSSLPGAMEMIETELVPKTKLPFYSTKHNLSHSGASLLVMSVDAQHNRDGQSETDNYSSVGENRHQAPHRSQKDSNSGQSDQIDLGSQIVDTKPQDDNNYNNTTSPPVVSDKPVGASEQDQSASDMRETHTLALPFPRPRSAIRSTSSASSRDSTKTPTFAEPPQRCSQQDNDSCIEDDDEVFSDVSTAVFFSRWRKFKERAGSKNSKNSKGSVKSTGSRKRFARERQMTFMLLSVTAAFIFSWFPPWVLYIFIFWGMEETDQKTMGSLYIYIGSLYLVNYVASPVIYYVFNVTYRAKVKALYSPVSRLLQYCRR